MKKTSVLLIAAALILSSCGIIAQQASSDEGHRYQDGLYGSTPSFRSKAEKETSQKETDELINRTKASEIYLFGDRKDTVAIPENMYARIQYDQKVGGTVVTVGENPYDWRWDLENNYGYYYGPYSIGSSWYWSRYYSPYYSSWCYSPYWSSWGFGPYWNRWGYIYWSGNRYFDPWYYDPWYYGGWYYGGWYDPWYYGGYYGWYGPYYSHHFHHGWYDPYYHHHGHGPGHIVISPGNSRNRYYGLRANTDGSNVRASKPSGSSGAGRSTVTVRRGIGTSSSVSRSSSTVRSSSASRSTSGRKSAPVYRRPESSSASGTVNSSYNSSTDSPRRSSESGYSRDSYNRSSSSSGSSYSRGSSSSGGFSRGGSGFSGGSSSGGGYSRGSSGGHRR